MNVRMGNALLCTRICARRAINWITRKPAQIKSAGDLRVIARKLESISIRPSTFDLDPKGTIFSNVTKAGLAALGMFALAASVDYGVFNLFGSHPHLLNDINIGWSMGPLAWLGGNRANFALKTAAAKIVMSGGEIDEVADSMQLLPEKVRNFLFDKLQGANPGRASEIARSWQSESELDDLSGKAGEVDNLLDV